MSARLIKAAAKGKVVLQNRTHGEVAIRFIDPKTRQVKQKQIPPIGSFELVPRYTTAALLKHSNVQSLIRSGVIRVIG